MGTLDPMEVDDLCTQKDLDQEKLLETLRIRYTSGQIYTNSGLFLISINPYTDPKLYGRSVIEMYKMAQRKDAGELKPHIYSLLNECLEDAVIYGRHAIVVTGESGSGKTETTRRMMEYLGVEEAEHANKILEAMGNAKTSHNNNSSRFGKIVNLDGQLSIEAILLERSRVTSALKGENFHIFYAVLSAKGKPLRNDYVEYSPTEEDVEKYRELKAAAGAIEMDFGLLENIILGIAYLGSLRFDESSGEVIDFPEYNEMLKLLALDKEGFESFLTKKRMCIAGEFIEKRYSVQESITLRDSFGRLLYEALFGYSLECINRHLKKHPVAITSLSILDIFGFENFVENGLDQFCINWCNERIYDGFVRDTVERQCKILQEEGIDSASTGCKMPQSNIEGIEKKCGIADLVGEESLLGGTAESLSLKIKQHLGIKPLPFYKLPYVHYAGKVIYTLEDFVKKNREKCNIREVYAFAAAREVSKHKEAILGGILPHAPRSSSVNLIQSFRKDMEALFATLSSSKVKYVRCIKPNNCRQPFEFDEATVSSQLLSSGVLQAVEISKALYPHSLFIDDFEMRYGKSLEGIDQRGIVRGNTRCFFGNEVFVALEEAREEYLEHCRNVVVTFFSYVAFKKYMRETEDLSKGQCESQNLDSSVDISCSDLNEKLPTLSLLLPQHVPLSDDLDILIDPTTKEKTLEKGKPEIVFPLQEVNDPKSPTLDLPSSMEAIIQKTAENIDLSVKPVRCENCEILEQKYKIQSARLKRAQQLEEELNECKARLCGYEKEVFFENTSIANIFGCFIQLYLDYAPSLSSLDIPRDEILSMAHGIFFVLSVLDESAYSENLIVCIDEINKRLSDFEENISKVTFVLSNMIELRVIFNSDRSKTITSPYSASLSQNALEHLNTLISTLFTHLSILHRFSITDLSSSVLEYQHVKEFRIRESIYKKLFPVPSISKLISALNLIYNTSAYFYLPDVFIINCLSYILSYIDFVVFNSLLTKKRFFSLNRCIQINHNILEIEKFCTSIQFYEGIFNMPYIREAVRVGFEIARGEKDPDQISNGSFFTSPQLSAVWSLFGKPLSGSLDSTFIDQPTVVVPSVTNLRSIPRFVHPKFLPAKSIKSIMHLLEEAS